MKLSAVKTMLLCLLLPALMLVRPVIAQTNQTPSFHTNGLWECQADGQPCLSSTFCGIPPPGVKLTSGPVSAEQSAPVCLLSVHKTLEACEGFYNANTPILCCYGYDTFDACRNAYQQPAPPPDPAPQPDPEPTPDPTPQPEPQPTPAPAPQPAPTSSSGGGGGGVAAPLLVAVALFAFTNYMMPSPEAAGWWPEDLRVRPRAHMTSRDGVSAASANITANYGDWRARAWSYNAGQGWSAPGVSAHWSALSGDSWTLNAHFSHSGGQWTRPYAKVEWTWEF